MKRTRLSVQSGTAIAVAMILIAVADAQIDQVSLWPLYIGPVVVASWEAEFRDGAIVGIAAGLLLVAAVGFSGHPYSHALYLLVATASQVASLVLIAWLSNRLAATQSLLLRLLGPNGASQR